MPTNIIIDSTNITTLQDEYLLNSNKQLEIIKKYSNGGKEKVFVKANHPTSDNCKDLLFKKNTELQKIIRDNSITCNNQTINAEMRTAIWQYFSSDLQLQEIEIGSIKIRPHPSENIEKYNWVKNETILPITFSNGNSLITEVAESDIVVGCESMAMVVGLIAGKRVISTIPPEGRECQLPQVEIEKLKEL